MEGKADIPERTIGVDVGDRYSQVNDDRNHLAGLSPSSSQLLHCEG